MVWRNARLGLLAASLVLNGCSDRPEEAAETLPPQESIETLFPQPTKNLLLICIDTVRADVFYGLGEAQKDSLSDWQDRALVFEHVTSTSSWTLPTLGSVFSGLWQPGHGLGQFPGVIASIGAEVPTAMYRNVPVLAKVAEQEGFKTTVISASAWTNTLSLSFGLLKGFSEVFKVEEGWRYIIAKLEEVLEHQSEDDPKFIFLHLIEAHNWHMEPEPDLDVRIDKLSPRQRALFLKVAPARACEDEKSLLCKRYLVYASAVSNLREAIAAALETIQEKNLLEDTTVIMFSDHGEEFGDHADDPRLVREIPSMPDYFVGHGHSMYQELLHVPLMVWHPQYEGAAIQQLVSLVDVGPTAARWMGIDFKPAEWPGQFLDTYIASPQSTVERVVYASGLTTGEQQVGVRQGNEKSIFYLVSDESDYYDLGTDPHELQNNSTPQLVMFFDGLLLDFVQSMPKTTPEKGVLSEEQLRRLQSIGYLQGLEVGEAAATE
jgi:arylsulfatase A-like enzyme